MRRYFCEDTSFISCFTSVFVSADTIFYNFLELHLTLSEKYFYYKFSFFKKVHPKLSPLMAKICYSFVTDSWGEGKGGWIKCTSGKLSMILRGFFSQNLQFDPTTIRHKRGSVIMVCTPFRLSAGLVELSLLPNFQKRGEIHKISILREGLLVKRVVTFLGGAVFI